MAWKQEEYRQHIPDIGLSIERNTEAVPSDGMYYLLHQGKTLGKFNSLKKAQARFRELVAELGYQPKTQLARPKSAEELDIERYMDSKDLYWAESHKYRGRGGKGGRGGV